MKSRQLLIASIFLSLPVLAAAEPPIYQRVDFSTEVALEIPNDQMNATLSIELSDKDAGKLAQQLATVVNDAMKKASAYPSVKVSSGNQNTWPVYGSTLTSSSKLESWRGRAEVRLETKDFKAAGELIGKLQEKLQINGISFVVSADSRRKVEDGLTVEAIAAFKARAEAIRSAWSAKSYKLVQMSLGSAGGPMPYMPMMRTMKAVEADSAPGQALAGGDTRLVVNVSGSIELQP
ncbi:MAG: SIMPL domain-containing protein [Moraxellaceae bacterium]